MINWYLLHISNFFYLRNFYSFFNRWCTNLHLHYKGASIKGMVLRYSGWRFYGCDGDYRRTLWNVISSLEECSALAFCLMSTALCFTCSSTHSFGDSPAMRLLIIGCNLCALWLWWKCSTHQCKCSPFSTSLLVLILTCLL